MEKKETFDVCLDIYERVQHKNPNVPLLATYITSAFWHVCQSESKKESEDKKKRRK